jgi:hypothetical protein
MKSFDGPCRVWRVGRKGGRDVGDHDFFHFTVMPNLPIAGQGCTSTPSKSRLRSVSLPSCAFHSALLTMVHDAWRVIENVCLCVLCACVRVARRVAADTDGG